VMVPGDLLVAAAREAQAAMERAAAAAAEGRMQRRTVAAVQEGRRQVDRPASMELLKRADSDRAELVELAVPAMGALAAIASVKNASSVKMLVA